MDVKSKGTALRLVPLHTVITALILQLTELTGGIIGICKVYLCLLRRRGRDDAPIVGGGHKEAGVKLGAESYHTKVGVIGAGLGSHKCEMAVAELEKHACKGLQIAGAAGPHKGYKVGVGNRILYTVALSTVILVDGELNKVALLKRGDGAHALPHLGVGTHGVYLAVDIGVDGGLVAFIIVLDAYGHPALGYLNSAADFDSVAVLTGDSLKLFYLAVLTLNREVASQLVNDILHGYACYLGPVLILVTGENKLVGPRESLAAVTCTPHTYNAVVTADIGGVVGHNKPQSVGGRIGQSRIHPVEDDLPRAYGEGILDYYAGSIVLVV